MSEWLRYCAIGVAVALFGFVLRSLGWSGARVFSTLGAVAVLAIGISVFRSVSAGLEGAVSDYGVGEVFATVLKIVGVGYVFGICSDICRELGDGGVAGALTLVGRGSVLLVSIPTLIEIVGIAAGIGG